MCQRSAHLADDNVSPRRLTFSVPNRWATRLMPSVVPRTNTSSAERALSNRDARYAHLHAFGRRALNVWIPRCTAA